MVEFAINLHPERSKVRLDNWWGLTLARLGWWQIDSEVGVEAAKGRPYRLRLPGDVQLLSEVYASC
jgi:hypothetical protein